MQAVSNNKTAENVFKQLYSGTFEEGGHDGMWISTGPLGFQCSHHRQTTRPPVERTAEEGIVGGSAGVFGLIKKYRARIHTEPKSAVLRLMVSHGWSIRFPAIDTPQGERDCVGG